MIVNTGTYRRTEFRFDKYVNGNPVFSGGFPLSVSFLTAFAQYPAITEEELSAMSQTDYLTRLNAFYQYLALQYPFFIAPDHIPDVADNQVNSHGEDLTACPVELSPEFLPLVRLQVDYFTMVDGLEAEIKIQSIDRAGNPVAVTSDKYVDYILKEVGLEQTPIWDAVEGRVVAGLIVAGTSETVIVPRFRFRGTETDLLYKSVFVQLYAGDNADGFKISEPNKVSITLNQRAFLTNFLSTLASSYQDQLTQDQIEELVKTGMGEQTLGKSTYRFTFQPNIPQRPVFIYPASWGLLEGILYTEGQDANLLEGGAFLLTNGQPLQVTLTVDGSSGNYFVYSARNLIIYPKNANYLFKFSGT